MSHRVFIAISTGQSVANIPPLLEHMAGNDELVWLESEFAVKKGWAEGAAHVINQRLRVSQQRILVKTTMQEAISSYLNTLPKSTQIVVVGNGGTKLQLLSLWHGVREADFMPSVLYGEGRPCGWVLTEDPGKLEKPQPYQKTSITLADVLTCSGHDTQTDFGQTRIWPAPQAPKHSSAYGVDADYTRNLHNHQYRWESHKAALADSEGVSIREALRVLHDNDKDELIAYLKRLFGHMRGSLLKKPTSKNQRGALRLPYDEPTFVKHNLANMGSIQSMVSILEGMPQVANRLLASDEVTTIPESLGFAFENAVAARVYQWLCNDKEMQAIVSEVHSGVKVVKKGAEETVVAEYDVLIVLRNGVLFNLECKSFSINQKDYDARETNLKNTSSNLANTVLAMPIYTDMSHEPWFDYIFGNYQRFGAIAYTLPGQPTWFEMLDEETQTTKQVNIIAFEKALKARLNGFLLH